METISPELLREMAPTGMLRVAINLGNPVLAARDHATGELQGVSIDLAREMGRQLSLPVTFTPFNAAGKVFEAVPSNTLDVMFLAIDPVRAAEIFFTGPYVIIEGTYLIRAESQLRQIEEFDRDGVQIAVGKGAAYDLFLTRTLRHATLVRSETSEKAIDLFVTQNLDAAAGVRQPLLAYAASNPGFRVIEGRFTAIEQAVGTPKGRPGARAWLHSFVEDMKRTGFVAAALERHRQHGASVAPPCPSWPVF
jgi:polar amino acid transport system substrate-binding protein